MFDASATDHYVSADKDYGSGPNGEVIEGDLLYDTIQGAIDKASAGDTIWVKDGFVSTAVYGKKSGWGCSAGVYLTKAITLRSQSGDARTGNPPILKGAPPATPTVVVHDGIGLGGTAVTALRLTAAATIKGLVFEGGSSSDSNSAGNGGGGVYVTAAAQFDKCVIRNNMAAYGGGVQATARDFEGNAPTFTDCVFSNNWAWFKGGAAYGCATYRHCDIVGNLTTNNSSLGYCPGIHGGSLTYKAKVYDCIISNNMNRSTRDCGGAYYVYAERTVFSGNTMQSTAYGGAGAQESTLIECQIVGNKTGGNGGGLRGCVATNCLIACNSAKNGGGVCNGTTVGCIISNNTATSNGGGMYFNETGFVNIGNRIVCNEAVIGGGGLHDSAGEGCSYDCLIAWNTMSSSSQTTSGGGVSSPYPSRYTRLINCTVISNRSVKGVGGVYHCDLINSISWGNVKGEKTVSDYSGIRVATNSCCSGFTDLDAALAAGCTTADPKFRRGCVYQIGPRSPCRETGAILTDDAVFSSMQKDIDGNPRFGEKDGVTTIDMGCCQYAPFGLMMLVK